MAESYKKLYQGQPAAAASTTTMYTVPAATSAIVKQMRIVNTSTTTATTIKIWNGGTADSNVILPATSIDAGGFAEFDGTITLATGETLIGQTGAATITVTIYGVELT